MRIVRASLPVFALAALAALAVACGPRREGRNASAAGGAAADPIQGGSIGQRAPAFDLPELATGERIRIPSGNVTVVMFFATWSAPDKVEMSVLEEIFAEHADAGLTVIGVSVDDEKEGVLQFAKALGVTFPVVWDVERRVAQAFRPETEPATYVLDRDGTIRHLHRGYHDGEQLAIDDEVSALLYPACSRQRTKTLGLLCMHHCERLVSGACVTSSDGCRLACERANVPRNEALATCRRRGPRAREACEDFCRGDVQRAHDVCNRQSRGTKQLLDACDRACDLGACLASCRL